jgi:hypothetical protein
MNLISKNMLKGFALAARKAVCPADFGSSR